MLKRTVFLIVAAATMALGSVAEAQSASELLEKGIYNEETVGDLDAAIKIYEKIVGEDQANRQFVAQAQFRLGKCLAKQGKKEEAQKVFLELVDQFKDSPAQKELVEKARKLLPAPTRFVLDPVPWSDGEHLEVRIKLAGGLEIGDFTFSAKAGKDDGRDVWLLTSTRNITLNAPNLGFSQVVADRESFAPIHSIFRHSILGTAVTDYTADQAKVQTTAIDGKKSERTMDLKGVFYDNEQGWFAFRRLPLTDDYKASVPIFTPFGQGAIELEAEVTGKEQIETPAGTFNCYKLFLKLVQQTFWISDDPHRYVVKFEAGGVSGILQSVRQMKPGGTITQTGDRLGFSVTAPADWYFLPQPVSEKESKELLVAVDPEARAVTRIEVHSLDSLSSEDRKSVRTWAEKRIAEVAAMTKDHKVREDSWQERQVGGLPAVSCVADFLHNNRKRSESLVFILGKSTAAVFSAHSEPDELDAFREKLAPIIDSYKEK